MAEKQKFMLWCGTDDPRATEFRVRPLYGENKAESSWSDQDKANSRALELNTKAGRVEYVVSAYRPVPL